MPDSLLEAPPDSLPASWLGPEAPPLEIDLGCHKGLFLVEMAARFPGRNFLGVELQAYRVEKTRRKIQARGLPNAAVIQTEGLAALKMLPEASAEFVHVLFPDPWPKRRHQDRRLVQARFLDEVCRVLKPDGFLRLVTDDGDYAQWMEELVAGCPQLTDAGSDDRVYPTTEFQKKFLLDGRAIHSFLRKRQSL